ncbi:hypothetical protein GM672_25615 [Massilia buxea]|uniref:Uncharacterized protein n=1 Tax=Pseudoduganella buxea TaxID=1949069 RepID=A0A6I3T5S3_9BURK|nr:hypothetical protein [Pseudoduganella buxea]
MRADVAKDPRYYRGGRWSRTGARGGDQRIRGIAGPGLLLHYLNGDGTMVDDRLGMAEEQHGAPLVIGIAPWRVPPGPLSTVEARGALQ